MKKTQTGAGKTVTVELTEREFAAIVGTMQAWGNGELGERAHTTLVEAGIRAGVIEDCEPEGEGDDYAFVSHEAQEAHDEAAS